MNTRLTWHALGTGTLRLCDRCLVALKQKLATYGIAGQTEQEPGHCERCGHEED